MNQFNRRNFLQKSGLGLLPAILPLGPLVAQETRQPAPPEKKLVKFYGDGEMFEPGEYLKELGTFHSTHPIVADRYGSGGAVEELQKKFVEITGKEKAIYLASGTMANTMAVKLLSGDKSKVFVQETSHLYRDEADAAQTVYNKRLMPLAKDQAFFTAKQLQDSIEQLPKEEVFDAGIGAVSVENPVRRANGRYVPLEELKAISSYCRSKKIGLHLDGARIYMASVWTGISVREYADLFDTVYISLYKYLGASGGAILCGSAAIIDQVPHLMKVHGGSMYGSWLNASMALNRLEKMQERLLLAKQRSAEIFDALNKINGVKVTALDNGTNIYDLQLPATVDRVKFQKTLRDESGIVTGRANDKNLTTLQINETLLYQDAAYVIAAFRKALS
ncbi:MAG: aminotransferase class I/II-fold pyridoxal phosphate-dependent enzyme [Chitinophagaceae bacterium]|nr:MAG: aminotransferase class I/II-fold pyridoxal phosphate-dependent enzyme [Chitinophagaceae bacterium]